jgi:hypothetical protein
MAASSMGSPTRLGPAGVGVGVDSGPPGSVVKREVEGVESGRGRIRGVEKEERAV